MKFMKVDCLFPERSRSVSENYFSNFYFLNVDISLTMSDTNLKLYSCIKTLLSRELCLRFFIKVLVHFVLNLEKDIHKNR